MKYMIEHYKQDPDCDYPNIVFWDYIGSSAGRILCCGFPQPMGKDKAERIAQKVRERWSKAIIKIKPIKSPNERK